MYFQNWVTLLLSTPHHQQCDTLLIYRFTKHNLICMKLCTEMNSNYFHTQNWPIITHLQAQPTNHNASHFTNYLVQTIWYIDSAMVVKYSSVYWNQKKVETPLSVTSHKWIFMSMNIHYGSIILPGCTSSFISIILGLQFFQVANELIKQSVCEKSDIQILMKNGNGVKDGKVHKIGQKHLRTGWKYNITYYINFDHKKDGFIFSAENSHACKS